MEINDDDTFVCEACGRDEEDWSYAPLCLDCYHRFNDEED